VDRVNALRLLRRQRRDGLCPNPARNRGSW
jgi:hypothetical protein